MDVPGSQGWAFAGDKTVEFARNPLLFIEKRVTSLSSKVFYARALNKPTVFVTSSKGVKEILVDNWDDFNMGFRDFGYIYDLYGDMLIFADGQDAKRLRGIIQCMFNPSKCRCYAAEMSRVAEDFLGDLQTKMAIPLYSHLKEYTTALCLHMFLDIDWKTDHEIFNTVKSTTTMHWHGLYSVPVNLKIKGWSSAFSKAMEAREYLLSAINSKLTSNCKCGCFLEATTEAGFESTEEASNHLLLFVSALIPKALASLSTSFCLALSGQSKKVLREKALESDEYLDCVLMEVQRLWPPFLGGRRITNKEVVIDGYRVPANTPVAYMSWFANRDATVFQDATVFDPDRWIGKKDEFPTSVWTFGAGPRCCVGINFINRILKVTARLMLERYNWTASHDESDTPYKTLPVARPRDEIVFRFTERTR